jgi:Phytanoyl-CoA dioxygenase (PhyH)
MTNSLSPEQLRTVIQQFAKGGSELSEQCRKASDLDYWRSINPDLAINSAETVSWDSSVEVLEDVISKAAHSYRTYGFFSIAEALSIPEVEKMRQAVEAVRQADWPPVFSFVYDSFWLIGRSKSLKKLLAATLHPNYQLIPQVWVHYLYPAEGNAGWVPHLDGDSNSDHTTSVWIPLSRATLTNGCMYIVRRTTETSEICKNFHNMRELSQQQVYAILKNTRALPSEPGHILCWDEKILHWGGCCENGLEARVSVALTFAAPSFQLQDGFMAMTATTPPPPFKVRLQVICRSILSYRRFEPLVNRFTPLAKELLKQNE